ncbi:hypothetical protein TNCV_4044501 [Trichonephila clavipes]|nr:hypothetical protein TNCV_4044501 [Trichonephila clavipes]
MATPGSSFTPTPLGQEDNLGVRYDPQTKIPSEGPLHLIPRKIVGRRCPGLLLINMQPSLKWCNVLRQNPEIGEGSWIIGGPYPD